MRQTQSAVLGIAALVLAAVLSPQSNAQSASPASAPEVRDHRDRPANPSTDVRDHRDRPVNPSTDVRDHRDRPVNPSKRADQSFWTTLPGILTGVAAVIAAIATVLTAFRSKGK